MPITPARLPRNADEVVDQKAFFNRVLPLYEKGVGDIELEADLDTARSVVPAGSGGARGFLFIRPGIPEFIGPHCVGGMDTVTQGPETALFAQESPKTGLEWRPRRS